MSIIIYDGSTLYTDSGTIMYGNYLPLQEKHVTLNNGTIFAWCGARDDFRKAIEAACAITNSCALPVVEVKIKD